MDIEELKEYARKIFNVSPEEEIESFRDFLHEYSTERTRLYAIAFLAEKMAQYIDESIDKSNT